MSEGSSTQAGFFYQNILAAIKVLDLLDRKSEAEYVHLENFKKGPHIDDIIVTRKAVTDFYQVKWSEDENNAFTLFNIIYQNTEDDTGNAKKSLWEKLVKGYNASETGGKPQTITLYSTRPAGNGKMPSKGINKSLKELIAFHNKVLKNPEKTLKEIDGYGDFEPLINKIIADKGPTSDKFEYFFKCLRFELEKPDLENIDNQLNTKLGSFGLDASLSGNLLKLVVQWSISGEKIDKDTLNKGLGLNSRFEDKIPNTFKVNEALYIENAELFTNLNEALQNNNGGFILVEGVPGAGKSTALTKYFEKSEDIHFSYYCFLPEDAFTVNQRMRSKYFLKSLCIAIENAFKNDDVLPHLLSENYEDIFVEYIQSLSKLDKRIIILVDGLDHIHRSLDIIADPLTAVLPLGLPENVYFIISSQYLAALPNDLRALITSNPERRIFISRFDQNQIREYLNKKGLYLSDEQEVLLLKRSEGIPLYLHYITESLINKAPDEILDIINGYPELENGDISTYHTILFQQITTDENALWIFSLLAKRRIFSTVEIIIKIVGIAGKQINIVQAGLILERFRYLLKERDGSSYAIFHNSFREFLLEKTKHLDAIFANAQAEFYAGDPFEFEAFNSYFDQLYRAGRFLEIIGRVDDKWITGSWHRHRSTDEILENLQIAWKAAVSLTDINSFIRIAFLIAQVGAMKATMENTDVDTTMLFLHAKLPKDSLGTIWDGEFTHLSNLNFFNYYVYKFAEITGGVIPESIAHQFFKRFIYSAKNSADDEKKTNFSGYFTAKTLYSQPSEWISEVVSFMQDFSDEDKETLIRELGNKKLLSYLLAFYETETIASIKNLACCFLAIGLAAEGGDSFKEFLELLDFDILSNEAKVNLIVSTVAVGRRSAIFKLVKKVDITPFIEEDIMERAPDYRLAPGMTSLFDQLKVLYLQDDKNYAKTELRINYLNSYPGRLYKAFSTAAKLWGQYYKTNAEKIEVDSYKTIIDLMLVSKIEGNQLRAQLNGPHFIIYHIQELYKQIFTFFREVCDDADLLTLAQYWRTRHPHSGLQVFESDLELAAVLNGTDKLKDVSALIITDAESLARSEDGTSSLVTNLYKIADSYGTLGFMDDFDRVYMDLLPLSCGIADRKDYQFASIIPLLQEVNEIQPAQTLARFAEIYELLFRVKDVSDLTIKSRSFGVLIKFIIAIYPELGFKILKKDEAEIHRDEVLSSALSVMIERSDDGQLPFIWAIINTLNRWEHFGNADDDNVHSTHKEFFERLSKSNDLNFIESAYLETYYQYDVEQNNPLKIQKINELLGSSGHVFSFLINPPSLPKEQSTQPPWIQAAEPFVKFLIKNPKRTKDELLADTKSDFLSVERYVENYQYIVLLNRITVVWQKFYIDTVGFFEDWYNQIPVNKYSSFKKNLMEWQRLFLNQKPVIAAAWGFTVNSFTASLNLCFDEAIDLFAEFGFDEFLDGKKPNFKKLSRQLYFETGQSGSKISGAISNEDLLWLAELAAVNDVDKWMSFIMKRFSNETIAHSLLIFAKKVKTWNQGKAIQIVEQALDYAENRASSDKKVLHELLEFYYLLAPVKAKARVLQVFQQSHHGYTYEIQYDLWQNIKPWIDRFNDASILPGYYEANLGYNQKLAEGLDQKNVPTDFIINHKETKTVATVYTDYLFSLFDYPVVKIREAALLSLVNLFALAAKEIQNFAADELKKASLNTIEHFVVLLNSLYFKNRDFVAEIVNQCAWMFEFEHFNIREMLRNLVFTLNQNGGTIVRDVLTRAEQTNMRPLIPRASLLRVNLAAQMRPFNTYQKYLISELEKIKQGGESFSQLVHQARLDDGYQYEAAFPIEKEVYGHYNTNNSHDPLEINGPEYQATQAAINKLFVKEISVGNYEDDDIQNVSYDFRLYDPTDTFNRRIKRPLEINYRTKEITPTAFLNFEDINELTEVILSRNESMITVFESGEDWVDGYPEHYNTKFTISLFLTEDNTTERALNKIIENYDPFLNHTNLYRSEIAEQFFTNNPSINIKNKIFPIVGTSRKYFRLNWADCLAVFLPHIAEKLQITADDKLNWFNNDRLQVATFTEWQSNFKDYSTRTLQPCSYGGTLMMERELLKSLLLQEGKKLNLFLNLKRTMDRYKPTAQMNWANRNFIKEISL